MEYIKLIPGYRTALADGILVPDSPKHMATEVFYYATAGNRLSIHKEGYLFAVAVYSLKRDPSYIYSYAYQKEENWATYTGNLLPESYSREDYVFDRECYFRVCVKRADGEDITEKDIGYSGTLVAFSGEKRTYEEKPWFKEEIEKTVSKIKREENFSDMKICLLADTHVTVNGTWEDTAYNINSVSKEIDYDAIVHLGDLTDGMLSKEMTSHYVKKIINDLEQSGIPLYITLGNHDNNYFRNKQNTFTAEEMRQLYKLQGNHDANENEKEMQECLDYYVDIPKYSVRMVFLSSFTDTAQIRYGYKKEQLQWLKMVLNNAGEGTKFLIFSHDAPLAQLDYWSFYIRNGEELIDVIEECNSKEQYQVIGLFYGHTHADYIFEECSFPIVSVGCAKLEYFTDRKPKYAVTWERQADTVTQDLWDSLLINFETQQLQFIRFGAGKDRKVSFAKKKKSYRDIMIQRHGARNMKIWAHRGASAHAPENTLPAFELACKMRADGIELDVQLSKDGVPVVIHDEKIDRVSDGTGWVKDYTLEELKKLNFNKGFPAYGTVSIPTLSEFFDLIKHEDIVINLELKNNKIFYADIEEKVLKLAEEKGIEDRIIYSSFNHYSMQKVKQLKPKSKIAFLYSDGILDIADYADQYQGYAVHPSRNNMEYPDVVKKCHAKNIKVHVWTINEEEDFEKMRRLGVDAVITNFVEKG